MANLIKFEPLKELFQIRNDFDRFFDINLLKTDFGSLEPTSFYPKIEIQDKKNTIS